MKRLLLLIAVLSIASLAKSQTAELAAVQIRKQLTANIEPQFKMGFLIRDEKPIRGILPESKIHSIADPTGFDILQAHLNIVDRQSAPKAANDTTQKDQQIIDYDESGPLPTGEGFLLTLYSFALPKENTKEIQVKAEIIYSVVDSDSLEAETIEGIILKDATNLPWKGKNIPLIQSGYWDGAKGQMYRYRLKNSDLGAAVHKIEQVDSTGNVLKEIDAYLSPHRTEFALAKTDEPMNLKITYKKLRLKKIIIDETIDLGL